MTEGEKMRAYLFQSPKNVEIAEREKPELKDNEILIKIKNIGICGSDVALYNGKYSGPHKYPMLFGHEWSGIVAEVGKKVTGISVGDKVTGDCSRYCGTCEYCKVDKNLCKHIEKFGITVDGASAEYIVRDAKYVYKAPEELDFDLICLTEPIAVAAHMIKKILKVAESLTDKKILIMGGGPIGLASLMLLKKLYNCDSVDLYDIVENRMKLAVSLGAGSPSEKLFKLNSDENNYNSLYTTAHYDIIIETTGNAKALVNTIHMAKPMGIIGCVGMLPNVEIPQKLIVLKSLTVIGSIGGTGEFEEVLDFIKTNPDYVRHLISHKFPITDCEKAFEACRDAATAMKVELYFED